MLESEITGESEIVRFRFRDNYRDNLDYVRVRDN